MCFQHIQILFVNVVFSQNSAQRKRSKVSYLNDIKTKFCYLHKRYYVGETGYKNMVIFMRVL
jgi:hypothetical protein